MCFLLKEGELVDDKRVDEEGERGESVLVGGMTSQSRIRSLLAVKSSFPSED